MGSDHLTPPYAKPTALPPRVATARSPVERMLNDSILSNILRLASYNVIAIGAATFISVAETIYVGLLGTAPLAAMALVFPFVVLNQNFSNGAMGGGISSAISRALGSRDPERAQDLALHAVMIGGIGGIVFTAILILFGPTIYYLLGGRETVLSQALAYSNTLFCGLLILWLNNSMVSIVRGTGNMLLPSVLALIVSTLQVLLGGGLGLGFWPFPKLGLPGVALGQLLATSVSMAAVFSYLVSGRGRVTLRFKGIALRRALFSDIAKPGALACFQPLQTMLIAVTFASLVSRFGTEALAGYSIGQRLEFTLIPVAFAVGAASVPMVGVAIGAGRHARARRVAWTAGAVSFVVLGFIGLSVTIAPDLWAGLFATQEKVLASARQYLRLAGPAFGFLGLGLTLFFAQQGSGKVLRPILASTFRLALVFVGGTWLVSAGFETEALFALSGVAMMLYGLATAGALLFTRWSSPVATAGVKGAGKE